MKRKRGEGEGDVGAGREREEGRKRDINQTGQGAREDGC